MREVPGVTDPLVKINSQFTPTQMGPGTNHFVEAAVVQSIRLFLSEQTINLTLNKR